MSTGPNNPSDPRGPFSTGSRAGAASDELLEAYLDGMLSPEEARVIERAMQGDSRLREMMELERSIENSIRSQFAPPAMVALNLPPMTDADRAAEAAAPNEASMAPIPISRGRDMAGNLGSRRWKMPHRFLAAAAAIALAGAGLWAAGVISPYGIIGITPPGLISPFDVYERKVATGFIPEWQCTTDQEFENVTRKAFGQALQIRKFPGVEVVGWSYYEPVLSEKTHLLLAKVDRKETIITIDSRSRARRITAPAGMVVYKKTIGNLVLYQTSKEGTRNILGDLYDPEAKEASSCPSENGGQ